MSPVSDPSLADDAGILREAMTGAARIALDFFGKDPASWEKGENSPVSEADIAVNDHLHEALMPQRPDYGWLSEESEDDEARLSAGRVWIVDPIDGTRAFLEGKPEFTICVGLAVNGEVVLAHVASPATEEHFTARHGAGAERNGGRLMMGEGPPLDSARILARRNVFRPDRWHGDIPECRRGYIGSLAYQLCLVAAGQWDAALAVNRLQEWDIAAAELILTEAGGRVTDQTGAALTYNRANPRINGMICAGPRLHEAIAERLIPKAL